MARLLQLVLNDRKRVDENEVNTVEKVTKWICREFPLFARAAARLRRLLDEGVTTVEVKSGYGLDRDTELRMLRAARRLGRELPVSVATTLVGLFLMVSRKQALMQVVGLVILENAIFLAAGDAQPNDRARRLLVAISAQTISRG